MNSLKKVFELIEKQQRGHEDKPRFMIGEQLKDIARREPLSAELLLRDLQIPEMSLEAAEKRLQKYSDDNHKSAKCFCITPAVAEKILREFYGLPKPEDAVSGSAEVKEEKTDSGFIDLAAFL